MQQAYGEAYGETYKHCHVGSCSVAGVKGNVGHTSSKLAATDETATRLDGLASAGQNPYLAMASPA